ncbi:uncharacterized protein [Linepithema humile]|uniref:uncharacterized protein n=1 Tax=Linepithema humile TaxID=83485 RepID=UPI00351E5B33
MEMSKEMDINVSASDTEKRHVGGIVPVPHGSASCEGLASTSAASVENRVAIASIERLDTAITILPGRDSSPGSVRGVRIPVADEVEMSRASASPPLSTTMFCTADYSDSEEIISCDSNTSKTKTNFSKVQYTGGRKRKKKGSPPSEENEEERYGSRFSVNSKKRVDEEMAGLELDHASNINYKIKDMVNEIENIRRKSTNIKGSFSGQMKVYLEVIRRASTLLSIKASSKEDPEYWKSRFYELEKTSLEYKCKADSLEVELQEVKRRERIKAEYDNDGRDSPVMLDDAGVRNVDQLVSASASPGGHRDLRNKKTFGEIPISVKLPDECGGGVTGDLQNRVGLDLAIINTLDRLGEGMNRMVYEMRQMKEAFFGSAARESAVALGDRPASSSLQKNIRINKVSNSDKVSWKEDTFLKPTDRQVSNDPSGKKNIKKKKNKNKNKVTKTLNLERSEDTLSSQDNEVNNEVKNNKRRKLNETTNNICGEDSESIDFLNRVIDFSENEFIQSLTEQNENAWTTVRRNRRGADRVSGRGSTPLKSLPSADDAGSKSEKIRKNRKSGNLNLELLSNLKKKIPDTAAVSILLDECELTYSDVLSRARERISLAELNISGTRIKRSANGGVLIEIPGADADLKADLLYNKLRELFFNVRGVSLRRPVKRSQLRLTGIDDSVTIGEVKEAISKIGSCDVVNITCSALRHMRGGLGVIFLQCPIAAAVKVLEKGKISIGWSTIGVEALKSRPMQCFRCLAVGHTIQRCPSVVVRRFDCYKCGQVDHKAQDCKNKIVCPVCLERGLNADHMVGSAVCKPVPPKRIDTLNSVNKDNVGNFTHLPSTSKDSEVRRPRSSSKSPVETMDCGEFVS